MPEENTSTEKTLKLAHLFYGLMAAVFIMGRAWGGSLVQQNTNKKEIDKKLEADIFKQHAEQQVRTDDRRYEMIKKGFETIDKRFDKLDEK